MRSALVAISLALLAMAGQPGMARPVKKAPPAVHRVRRGETAARIAKAAGMTVEQLAALNPRVNLSRLAAGMLLRVQGSQRKPVPVAIPSPPGPGAPEPGAPEPGAPEPGAASTIPPVPMSPLPVIRVLGPAVLVHLERLIPVSVGARP